MTAALPWQSAAAAIAIAVAAATLTAVPALDALDGLDLDGLHALAALAPDGWAGTGDGTAAGDASQTVVIGIDEATYAADGFAGLPKVMWTPKFAAVQDAVLAAGARVVGWDVILPTSAASWVADRRFDQPLMRSLAAARRTGQIVLGRAQLNERAIEPFRGFAWAAGGADNIRSLNLATDRLDVVRGVPLMIPYRTADGAAGLEPSFALELAARSLGVAARATEDGRVALGDWGVPGAATGTLTVRLPTAPGAIPTYSLADLHRCATAGATAFFEQAFAGKTAIFGLVLDVEDRKLASNRFATHPDFAAAPAPCDGPPPPPVGRARNATPGVYIHAAAVNNLVAQQVIVPPALPVRLGAAFALALAAAVLTLVLRPVAATAAVAGVALIWVAGGAVAFGQGLLVPVLDPIAGGVIAFGATLGYRFAVTDRERAQIRRSFSFYLAPALIDRMMQAGEMPKLGGETRELTCLFSDIAGFSGISEALSPSQLVRFLNQYFAVIGDVIEAEGGFIDKFIGDAVVAVFGAPLDDPDHALRAVSVGLVVNRRLTEAMDQFALPGIREVRTRFGINTGTMLVGNIGSHRRFNYTVMGDAVNLASRLEGVNKQYGTTLLVSDRTAELCRGEIAFREIDLVRVVGRETPVRLFEPIARAAELDDGERRHLDRFGAALAASRARDFAGAAEAFAALAAEGDPVATKMASRAAAWRDAPPPADWDGVTDLTSK